MQDREIDGQITHHYSTAPLLTINLTKLKNNYSYS